MRIDSPSYFLLPLPFDLLLLDTRYLQNIRTKKTWKTREYEHALAEILDHEMGKIKDLGLGIETRCGLEMIGLQGGSLSLSLLAGVK